MKIRANLTSKMLKGPRAKRWAARMLCWKADINNDNIDSLNLDRKKWQIKKPIMPQNALSFK